jgi:hypothetical protein
VSEPQVQRPPAEPVFASVGVPHSSKGRAAEEPEPSVVLIPTQEWRNVAAVQQALLMRIAVAVERAAEKEAANG